jgi:hypothetical protein
VSMSWEMYIHVVARKVRIDSFCMFLILPVVQTMWRAACLIVIALAAAVITPGKLSVTTKNCVCSSHLFIRIKRMEMCMKTRGDAMDVKTCRQMAPGRVLMGLFFALINTIPHRKSCLLFLYFFHVLILPYMKPVLGSR